MKIAYEALCHGQSVKDYLIVCHSPFFMNLEHDIEVRCEKLGEER